MRRVRNEIVHAGIDILSAAQFAQYNLEYNESINGYDYPYLEPQMKFILQ